MNSTIYFGFLCLASTTWADSPVPASTPAPSPRPVMATPAWIGGLSEELRTNHPALKASRARLNAADASVRAVRTWEDPMLRFGVMAASEDMRATDGDLIYGVEQKLPLFGKTTAARRLAAAERDVGLAGLEERFQLLRKDLVTAVMRTALANRVVRVGEEDLAWLESAVANLEQRYRSGVGTLVELLQLQNERARRIEALQTDRNRLAHEQIALNRLLNRDLQSSWPELALPAPAGPVRFNRTLLDLAVRHEPQAVALRKGILAAEAAVEVSRRLRRPDFAIGLQGRNYSGSGEFRSGEFMLSLNLPWGNRNKYRSDLERDEARRKAAEYDLVDYEQSIREEVHGLTIGIDAARRLALRHRDEIIPRAGKALETARAAWESGSGIAMFREALEARRMVLDSRLTYARAVAEQYELLAELVLCCGLGDLQALEMIGSQANPETNQEKLTP